MLRQFEKHISDSPGKIHVAPYRLYASGSSLGPPGAVIEWVHELLGHIENS